MIVKEDIRCCNFKLSQNQNLALAENMDDQNYIG